MNISNKRKRKYKEVPKSNYKITGMALKTIIWDESGKWINIQDITKYDNKE